MRISDWSSDVCSSDLSERVTLSIAAPDSTGCVQYATTLVAPSALSAAAAAHRVPAVSTMSSTSTQILPRTSPMMFITVATLAFGRRLSMMARRSEEHTSELQSLMRISYAVFCLKKKKEQTKTKPH